jgi:hypothetical protein
MLLAVSGALPAQARTLPKPVVTAAVQVTSDPDPVRSHSAPLVARNPKTGELVVVDVDVRGSRECHVYISTDDGRSWSPGGDVMVAPFTDCSIGAEYGPYAMPVFDQQGVLYVATTANDPKVFASSDLPSNSVKGARAFVPRNVYVSRSTDGGRTFTTALAFQAPVNDPGRGYNISPSIAIDPSSPSHVYVGWAQGDWTSRNLSDTVEAVVASSSDAGKTFGPPVEISNKEGSEHPWLAVGRDGTVEATYWSKGFGKPLADPTLFLPTARQDPPPIYAARSTDHGQTWTRQVIDAGSQKWYRPPVIVADANSDAVYVAWYDTAERMNFKMDNLGTARSDIYLSVSRDAGKTWSERKAVNDDAGKGANHLLPGLSIAPDGRLDVAWDDFRGSASPGASPDREGGVDDIYYTSSNDHGQTFGPNMRISDRSIDRSIGTWSNNIGSHVAVGVSSSSSAVYFAWQDSRDGNSLTQAEDTYAATMRFTAPSSISSKAPRAWLEIGAGILLGLGIAMALVAGSRRRAG